MEDYMFSNSNFSNPLFQGGCAMERVNYLKTLLVPHSPHNSNTSMLMWRRTSVYVYLVKILMNSFDIAYFKIMSVVISFVKSN